MITDALKLAAGFALGAILTYPIAHLKGKSEGKEEIRAEAAVEAIDRIEAMEDRNANFSNLPDRERCRIILRDSGLPVDRCDQR